MRMRSLVKLVKFYYFKFKLKFNFNYCAGDFVRMRSRYLKVKIFIEVQKF